MGVGSDGGVGGGGDRKATFEELNPRPKPQPAPWGLNYETAHKASSNSTAPKMVTPFDSQVGGQATWTLST